MKHQQVVVDYWTMLKTSCTCLLLAISGYVLIKMVQTIFYLPGYLKRNQKRLEELAAKYNLDLEKEIAESDLIKDELEKFENDNSNDTDNNKENTTKENQKEQDIACNLPQEPKKLK